MRAVALKYYLTHPSPGPDAHERLSSVFTLSHSGRGRNVTAHTTELDLMHLQELPYTHKKVYVYI